VRKTNLFSEEGSQMIAIGEETGQLSLMLDHLGKILSMDLEEEVTKVLRRIGPALIMGVGLIIGLVASGVLLPILEVGKGLQ
ncbi:MAG: type II secretion system F family protein, partial [Desulfitobacterium sp.]|nr:type II secretion system F family protein [Desulfitobacterium sp.]